MKALIVEDEKRLARALSQILSEAKYLTDTVYDGQDGLDYALSEQYDVIILDVMLPGLSGFQVARELRTAKIATPILMLTAKDEIADKVHGLDQGADDYMTKPFAPEELLARIRSLLRRPGEVIHEEIEFGDLKLNITTDTLFCGPKSVHLAHKELEILRILMLARQAITPKETLIIKVWGADSDADDNNVEAYISFLRKKFRALGSATGIEAIRRVGYRLTEGTP